jgi:hypothetical protein
MQPFGVHLSLHQVEDGLDVGEALFLQSLGQQDVCSPPVRATVKYRR